MPFSGWDTYMLLGFVGGALICPPAGMLLAFHSGNPWWMFMSAPLMGMFWMR